MRSLCLSVKPKNTKNILIKNTVDLCKYKNGLSLHITYATNTGADPIHEPLKEEGEWGKAILAKPMRQNLINMYKFINLHRITVLLCFTYQCFDVKFHPCAVRYNTLQRHANKSVNVRRQLCEIKLATNL